MCAQRDYYAFSLTLRPNSGKEQKSLQNRLNTGEKIRVTLLSPLCVSSSCSGLFTHKRVVFAREKKKGKKQKEFVTERRENNTEEEISLPSNVKIFKERGARAYTLSSSSSSSSSNARRKGLFSRFFLEKERRRRARGSVLGARFVKRERGRVSEWNARREEAKRQKNLSETCHHTNGTGNV